MGHMSPTCAIAFIGVQTDERRSCRSQQKFASVPSNCVLTPVRSQPSPHAPRRPIALKLWGVRYQVSDISRSVDFYTQQLGFELDHQAPPAFAQVSLGGLQADPQRAGGVGFASDA
jgi:hypothetical protein